MKFRAYITKNADGSWSVQIRTDDSDDTLIATIPCVNEEHAAVTTQLLNRGFWHATQP